MPKVKIDKRIFEMSEDASLILENHLDTLKLYLEKGKITKREFDGTRKNIEDTLLLSLDQQGDLGKDDIEKAIDGSKFKKKSTDGMSGWILKPIGRVMVNFSKIILGLFVVLFKLIVILAKIIALLVLGWIILAFAFGVPLVFFPWTIDNQAIFSFVPDVTKYALVSIELSFVLFFTYVLLSLPNSKFPRHGILSTAIVSLILWLNWVAYFWYNAIDNYWQSFDKVEKYAFDIKDAKSIRIDWLENLDLKLPFFWFGEDCASCNVIPTTSDTVVDTTGTGLTIEIRSTVNDRNKRQADEYFSKLNDLEFSLEWNSLVLKTPRDKQFKEIVPYRFLRRTVTVRKPSDVRIAWFDEETVIRSQVP